MAIREIILYPDSRLKERCKPVENITPEIKKLIEDMTETMYEAPGIGLAASQVGSDHRVIVVDIGDEENPEANTLYQVINPEIVEREGSSEGEEGCLSIPDIRANVERYARVVVQGLDPQGKPIRIDANGLLAVCFQHEIDHLDGILFIDRLSRLKRELLRSPLKELEKRVAESKSKQKVAEKDRVKG